MKLPAPLANYIEAMHWLFESDGMGRERGGRRLQTARPANPRAGCSVLDKQKSNLMPLSHSPFRRSRRHATFILAAIVASAGVAFPVRSADDAGIHAFIQSEARRAAPPGPSRATTYEPYRPAAPRIRTPAFESPKVLVRKINRAPRAAFAALHRDAEPAKPRKKAIDGDAKGEGPSASPTLKVKPIGGDPVAALLKDETLRPGDIAMFPDGPRVFKGDGKAPHKISAFEPARSSRLVSNKTRQTLASLKPLVIPKQDASQSVAEKANPDPSATASTGRGNVARAPSRTTSR